MGADDQVIIDIIARTDQLEREVQNARRQFDTETDRMRRASDEMRRRMEANNSAIGDTFKQLSGALGAYFSGREIIALSEGFTRFQNSLRVAGVAGEDLKGVQDRLFASAQKYGVELGTLGGLFSSLTNASKELGVSQEQIFRLTDTVAASLKVSGQSAEEASGALMQLGQALRAPKLQAEEFNSLLDGAFPLLEAAAAGSEKFGGSVGKLTAAVKNGEVSSREFFDAVLAGSEGVIKRADLATLSLAGAYTQVKNALTVYVGEAAQSSGAQAALASGIEELAKHLDKIIPALAVVATAMGVKYVLSAGAATVASVRADAALLGLSTRAEVAGFAFAKLATSIAINGALLAVTATIGAMGAEVATTEGLVRSANTQYDEMRKRLEATSIASGTASDGTRSVGDGAANAEPKVRSFAGAVGLLADQLFRQAKAAKEARLQDIQTKLAASQQAEIELGKRTPAGRNDSANDFRRGDFLNNAGVLVRGATGGLRSWLSGGRTDREAEDAYRKQVDVSQDLQRRLREEEAKPISDYVPPPVAAPAATGPGKKGGGKGRTPHEKTAEQLENEQDRIQQQIASAQLSYLQELAQSTDNASERAALEQQVIEATRAANEQDILADKKLSEGQRAQLVETNNQIAQLRAETAQRREMERLRQQQLQLTTDALRDEDGMLQLQGRLADTAKDRRDIELRRLDIAYRLEKAGLAEELVQAEMSGDLDRIAAARKRLADMEERRSLDTDGVIRDTEGPGESYRRQVNRTAAQLSEDFDEIKVDGLKALNSELADAITGAKSLGDAFSNVANQIINDLARIAIQQAIIKPLANSLFPGSGGGALASSVAGAPARPNPMVCGFRPLGESA